MSPAVVSARTRLEEKARQERRGRRLVLLRRTGWVLAGLAPLVVTGWLLLASPWFVVHRVVVKGETTLTAAQVLAAVDVRLGTPLAKVDTSAVAARVRGLGPVASVAVSRGWPDTLEVTVVERRPVVAVRTGTAWSLYDAGGVRLGSARTQPAGLVRLLVRAPGPHDPSTRAALAVLQQLPKPVRALVAAVQAASPEQVTLVLTDRRVVVWGGTADGRAKGAALVALLKLPGHVYDVSSPTVVTRR